MEWRVCQSWHSSKIFVWTARHMKWQQTTKRWVDTAKADLPTNDKGKLGDSWKKKKTGDCMWDSIFCWSRFGERGNKYLLKYYLVLCIVQFYLLPSPLGNRGTSPALQVWEWGIVWSSPVPVGRWVGQIKKDIFSLILRSTSYFLRGLHNGCGLQDYIFLRKNAGICQRVVGEE